MEGNPRVIFCAVKGLSAGIALGNWFFAIENSLGHRICKHL